MPRVGYEPTTPVFERAKRVHALDRSTTVIGNKEFYSLKRLVYTRRFGPEIFTEI
jgi:hypothetical protein